MTTETWVSNAPNTTSDSEPDAATVLDSAAEQQAIDGLLRLVEPLVQPARRRVRDGLASLAVMHDQGPVGVDSETLFYAQLAEQLQFMASRTTVLEMHVARLQGMLHGESPQDRYRDFIDKLGDPSYRQDILEQYPLLVEQILRAADHWADFTLEFAARLQDKWHALVEHFFRGEHPGALIRVCGGVGDRHQRSRSVLILEFESGRRLVYKPRSLAVDRHFQRFLEWMNRQGARPAFRTLGLLDCHDHGWVEFISAADCASRVEVDRFYRRQGGFLAILYLLSATDFHFENLIAAGEHPMLIDLEAMFPQPLPAPPREVAKTALAESVVKVRMLPQLFFVAGSDEVVDYSALNAPDIQETPYLVPGWDAVGTDEMRVTLRRALVAGGQHRPRLAGQAVNMLDYQGTFLRGFADTYRLLLRNRAELSSADGPIAAFARDEVRFIARITHIYAILLGQAFHPDRLSDVAQRDELFDRLAARTSEFPCLQRLLSAERCDLEHNDIPLFRCQPDSRHVWTSAGSCIEDFFANTALERAQARIAALDEDDLARQVWLIQASLGIVPRPEGTGAAKCLAPSAVATTRDPLNHASEVGARLTQLAWHRGNEIGWIDLIDRPTGWSIGPATCDVAQGLAGIALFFAHLGELTGQTRFTVLAQQTIHSVLTRIGDEPLDSSADVRMEIAAVSAHLGRLWNDASLAHRSETLRRQCACPFTEALPPGHDTWAVTAGLQDGLAIMARAISRHDGHRACPSNVVRMGLLDGLAGRGMKLLAQAATH